MTIQTFKNVVVVGGSYVGCAAASALASVLPKTHRVLVIEPHSHFHHLFAFPRFAVVPSSEHKAFIPYTGVFSKVPVADPPIPHSVIQARVVDILPHSVKLDREYPAGSGNLEVPFEYLVLATGTRLAAPGNVLTDDKKSAVEYFQAYQEGVKKAKEVVIIGGGAVGVQMATDIKEYYPTKEVTLVHSRDQLMPRFHPQFSDKIKERFEELGIKIVLGSRAIVPDGGYPPAGTPTTVQLQNGNTVEGDCVIFATGQTPNTQMLGTLSTLVGSRDQLINPDNGFVRVRRTTQVGPEGVGLDHIFAVGDIADSGAHKAARPAAGHAEVAAANIVALIESRKSEQVIHVDPAGIHMTLGLSKNVVCRNPDTPEGEPIFKWKDDGTVNMNIDNVWARRGVTVTSEEDYHL